MLALPAVVGALPDFQAIRASGVAVAAALTASPSVVDSQLDLAQRAVGLDYDDSLGFSPRSSRSRGYPRLL
jgi:hypothetical protein